MTSITHPDMVKVLAKPGTEISAGMTLENLNILLLASGVLIEAGEELDTAKKQVIYNKDMGIKQKLSLPESILTHFDSHRAHLLHMAIGIAGEAAELLEAVVRHVTGDPLDVDNCVEEIGDIEFYMEGIRQGLTLPREIPIQNNIIKLSERYKNFQYSDQAAQNRADKKDGE